MPRTRQLVTVASDRRRRVLGWLTASAALGVVAWGCSGGDDGETSIAITDPTVTTLSSDSTSTTTSPAEESSTTAASTAAMVTVPTTSNAPTTITDPIAQAEAAIRSTIEQSQADYSACLLALPACDPAVLSPTRAGPILEVNTARINEWNAAGYAVRDRDQFRFVIESVAVDPGGAAATAVVCIADGSKLVQPGAGPDGSDVIVDGAYVSGRSSWMMRLDPDGSWRVYEAPASGPTESSDVCPPA